MSPDELLIVAKAGALDRVQEDKKRLPSSYWPLLDEVAERFLDHGFNVSEDRRLDALTRGNPLGKTLSSYVEELRMMTAVRMEVLAESRIATGRTALAVGYKCRRSYCRAYERYTGSPPRIVELPARLPARFDVVTLHRALAGELTDEDARDLDQELRRRSREAYEGGPPSPALVAGDPVAAEKPSRSGVLPKTVADRAARRAAEAPIARLRAEIRGLPEDVIHYLEAVLERLLDPDLDLEAVRVEAKVADTAISTKCGFFVGETPKLFYERGRVETSLPLLADFLFNIERVAEGVAYSCNAYRRAFERRTGLKPSDVRKTLVRNAGRPICRLWLDTDGLSAVKVRTLAAHLRALRPGAFRDEKPLGASGVPVGEASVLAVRHNVDPRRIDSIVRYLPLLTGPAREAAVEGLETHPLNSGPYWYLSWVTRHLRAAYQSEAWKTWDLVNRLLLELLRFPRGLRLERIREDPRYQTVAFVWLLFDCVEVRRPHDPEESAHFAELALAAAEALDERGSTLESRGLVELGRALLGNVYRMRNDPVEAGRLFAKIDAKGIVDDWVRGLVLKLHAVFLVRRGQPKEARRDFSAAAVAFKQAGDELERVRCVVDGGNAWLASGVNPCKLMTLCLHRLERFNFEPVSVVREGAHLIRLFGGLYHDDRLTGSLQHKLTEWRGEFPGGSSSEAMQANLRQFDGLLAHLQGDANTGAAKSAEAAKWFEDHDLLADAAVAYLGLALCTRESDPESARKVARRACEYLKETDFRSHNLHLLAEVLQEPTHENLRELILAVVGAARKRPRPPKSA